MDGWFCALGSWKEWEFLEVILGCDRGWVGGEGARRSVYLCMCGCVDIDIDKRDMREHVMYMCNRWEFG